MNLLTHTVLAVTRCYKIQVACDSKLDSVKKPRSAENSRKIQGLFTTTYQLITNSPRIQEPITTGYCTKHGVDIMIHHKLISVSLSMVKLWLLSCIQLLFKLLYKWCICSTSKKLPQKMGDQSLITRLYILIIVGHVLTQTTANKKKQCQTLYPL